MLMERARGSTYETIETLHQNDEGAIVAALADGEDLLLFVPRSSESGRLEREQLAYLAGPGIPEAHPFAGDLAEALVLVGAAAARPLASGRVSLPDATWRRALAHLLSGLSQAHGRGFVHGRISRRYVLADPSGEFWIHGWAAARPAVGRGPFHAGIDDVATDIRDLGVAFVLHLGGAPDDEPEEPPVAPSPRTLREVDPAVVQRASSRVALFDRELARVLVRLVATDPREAYESATEILSDLGERDESLPDPWFDLPYVARRRLVRRVVSHAERSGTRSSEFASVQLVGPPGSGRTRFLHEVARVARERQLVVMVANGSAPQQPWGAIGSFARQMMARLPAGHPLRTDRGVRILVGEVPSPIVGDVDLSGGDGASASLAELLRAAFAVDRGVMLLDDEECLAGHASHAWRLLERHLSAMAGPSSPRVLLVSAGSRAAPDTIPTARERITLGDLTQRQLTQMLATVVTERGKAPILASELIAAAGPRPGEIVAHLREMADRKALIPAGRRFHVEDPVEAVRAAAAHRLRRSIESAGRDAVALAEALAVAGRLRLSRDTISEIAELPGHRLQAASESALRSGLLVRDGATWRLRTGSQAARVLAAMPDDRRRGLHRELLTRLLELPEPDWPAIADHGRASADPRAAEWTRHAFKALRAAGRFDEAATHFDDALALLEPGALDIDLRLIQVDTLLHAGRLDDATRCAAEIAADPVATPLQRGTALLSLARLHRYDQAWSKVLAIELPATCGDPTILARIRLLRAIAHVFRGRADLADREERLAIAEVGEGGADEPLLAYTRLDLRAAHCALSMDAAGVVTAILSRLRSQLSRSRPLDAILDLIRIANARRVQHRYLEAEQILQNSVKLARVRLGENPLVAACILHAMSLIATARDNPRRAATLLEAASAHAERTGAECFRTNKRIELAAAHFEYGQSTRASRALANKLGATISGLNRDTLAYALRPITKCLRHVADHRAIESLSSQVDGLESFASARWFLEESRHESCFQLEDVSPTGRSAEQLGPVDVMEYVEARRAAAARAYPAHAASFDGALPDLQSVWSLLACLYRRGFAWQRQWPEEWAPGHIAQRIQPTRAFEPHELDMLFSLLIAPTGTLSRSEWWRLAAISEATPREIPLALVWRRTVAESKACLRTGRVAEAMRLAAAAKIHLGCLDHPASGTARGSATTVGSAVLAQTGILLKGAHAAPAVAPRARPRALAGGDAAWGQWESELDECVRSRGVYVTCPLQRELELFVEELQQRMNRTVSDGGQAIARSEVRRIVMCPERWSPADVRRWLAEDRGPLSVRHAVVIASTLLPQALRSCSREHAAMMAFAEGLCVAVRSPTECPAHRLDVVRWALRKAGLTVEPTLSEFVQTEFLAYSWPGGLAEVEGVATEIVVRTNGQVDESVLDELGWRHRRSGSADALSDIANASVVLSAVRHLQSASCRQIAAKVARPTRTVVRALQRLAALGLIERRGLGRASAYRPARSAGPDGDSAKDAR